MSTDNIEGDTIDKRLDFMALIGKFKGYHDPAYLDEARTIKDELDQIVPAWMRVSMAAMLQDAEDMQVFIVEIVPAATWGEIVKMREEIVKTQAPAGIRSALDGGVWLTCFDYDGFADQVRTVRRWLDANPGHPFITRYAKLDRGEPTATTTTTTPTEDSADG